MPMDNNSVSALLLNIHCFEGLLLVDCPRESHKNGADVHSRDVITLQQKPSPFDFFLAILIQRDQLKRIYFQGKKKHSVQPTGSILRTLLKQFFGHFSYMKENMRVEARCNFRQLQDWKSKMLLSEMYHSAVTSLKMASHPLPHHGNALKTVNLLYLCGPRCPLQDATVISKSSIMPCAKFKNVNRQAHVEPTADTIQLTPTENYSPLLLKRDPRKPLKPREKTPAAKQV
ncbi:uncharacterized protein [Heterodontus francisci]|uniref:uncharacterized protein isoform X2 n=1 Tax=Heterodontus francisci TaxID=7792 RepID=UPI00355BDCCD